MFTWKKSSFTKSPIKFFLNWKWWVESWWLFEYYDKDLGQRVTFDIEWKKMVVLRIWTSVTWFSKASNKWIWSNEVEKSDEIITVRTANCDKYKDWIIAEWKWADIKDKVENAWWKYQRALTVLCEWDVIWLWLFGSWIWNWFDITKEDLFKVQTNYVVQKWSEKATFWKIEFIKPIYEFSSEISDDDVKKAIEASNIVKEYYDSRKWSWEKIEASENNVEDDIPF